MLLHILVLFHSTPFRQCSTETFTCYITCLFSSFRWVVEACNMLVKTWKFLYNVVPSTQIQYAGDYFRIICAICNAYRPPRVSPSYEDVLEAQRMLRLSKLPNHLQQTVQEKKWDTRRVVYQELTDDCVEDFPRLTLDELRYITMGVYQLKQSRSYTAEHLQDDGLYKLFYVKETPEVLRLLLRSRHTSSKQYQLWIEYGQHAITTNPISGWYCKCQVGARVVGCCAHIASVLWYLGFARHQTDYKIYPANEAAHQVIQDAAGPDWASSGPSSDSEVRRTKLTTHSLSPIT